MDNQEPRFEHDWDLKGQSPVMTDEEIKQKYRRKVILALCRGGYDSAFNADKFVNYLISEADQITEKAFPNLNNNDNEEEQPRRVY